MFGRITAVAAAGAALLLVSAGPVGAAIPHPAAPPPDRAAALRAALDAVHAAGMPGIWAEVREGSTLWRGTSGVSDVDTMAPVRTDFEHRIGSVTKTFVATTMLQLVAEGRVGLDDPVGRFVGDLLPADLASAVTVRMLLQHTSGINDYPLALFQSYNDIERDRTVTFSPQQLVALGLALPRTNTPGAAFFYSNTNYILTGLIIERVTAHPVELEVARRILLPLGLLHTYFPGTFPYIVGPHSKGYVPWPDGTLRDFSVYNMSWAWTAGAMISTLADVGGFYAALLTGRLLPPGLLTQMLTAIPQNPTTPAGEGYGLGLQRLPLPCGTAWGHSGGGFGYGTLAVRMADGRRQLTLADNMTLYAPAGTVSPIDVALVQFLVTALCGSASGASGKLVPLGAAANTAPAYPRALR